MLASSTVTSSSTAAGNAPAHNPGSMQQQEQAAAAAAASSHRRSSASSTRPASQQAAVNVAAAEAAVSAAAAVIKVGTQAHHLQQQQQKKALSVQGRQQQQLRSRKNPVKGSTKDCTSSGSPQPCAASTSSGLSQYMLLEPLSVHGVPHSAARQSSTYAADGCSAASPRAAASCCGDAASSWLPSATRQSVSGNGTALQAQHATLEQLHYQQLMLCPDSAPQTAAEILAARAKSRRMRIQQRNLLGPAAFARGTVQPRSASPPPILLDGEYFGAYVCFRNTSKPRRANLHRALCVWQHSLRQVRQSSNLCSSELIACCRIPTCCASVAFCTAARCILLFLYVLQVRCCWLAAQGLSSLRMCCLST